MTTSEVVFIFGYATILLVVLNEETWLGRMMASIWSQIRDVVDMVTDRWRRVGRP